MRPLDGITVVTLEHAIAAPFCTRQLADLGARVIKVERPGSGDFARAYDERARGLASHFVRTNRSKESLTLDVKHELAKDVLAELIARADVLAPHGTAGSTPRHRRRHLRVPHGRAGDRKTRRGADRQRAHERHARGLEASQLQARQRWTEVDTPAGPIPALLPPGATEAFSPRMDAVPALGQHTDSILAELGWSGEQIEALRRAQAI